MDGEALARLDAIVRSLLAAAGGAAAAGARSGGEPGAASSRRCWSASEREVVIEVEPFRVTGRIDLICRDVEQDETWVWDLKTYAGTDAAQDEQVRLYALASERAGLRARPALLHVTGERIEIARVEPADASRTDQLRARLQDMSAWLGGSRPPPSATDLTLCRACPAQDACWSRWGRTLDESAAPEPRVPAGGQSASPAPESAPGTPRRRPTLPPRNPTGRPRCRPGHHLRRSPPAPRSSGPCRSPRRPR